MFSICTHFGLPVIITASEVFTHQFISSARNGIVLSLVLCGIRNYITPSFTYYMSAFVPMSLSIMNVINVIKFLTSIIPYMHYP